MPFEPKALIVYFTVETYGPREMIILCDPHRYQFYGRHPDACGFGEWVDPKLCEFCIKRAKNAGSHD